MNSSEKLEKQRLKAEKQRQEDVALTKVLYWIVGAVVLEFLLLMTQKYYINFTVDDFGINLAVAIAAALKVITFAGIIAGAAVLALAYSRWKKGKQGVFLWALGVFLILLGIYSAVVWQFNATGVEVLIFANVVFAVLAFVYYIYQLEFFAVALTCAAGVLGIYVRFTSSGGLRTYATMALMLAVLVVVAAVAAAAQRGKGALNLKGKRIELLPKTANYILIYVSCVLMALVLIASMVIGTGVGEMVYYAVPAAWALIMAVYYTVKLM